MSESQLDQPRCRIPEEQAARLKEHYRAALFDDIVPWWMRHSPDREMGGFYACLERDGRVYAEDKFMWMLGRQIWMFSHLFNQYQPDPDWLAMAKHGLHFMDRYAFAGDGKMYFRLRRDGRPLANCLSMYTECFAAIAYAELSHADRNPLLWKRAIELYDRIQPRLGCEVDTPFLGYPMQAKFHLHAHDMMRLTLAWVFNQIHPGKRWVDDITLSIKSLVSRHWHPKLGALLENVTPDGRPMLDLPEGRLVNPGHAIESAWMLLEVAQRWNDPALRETAVQIIRRSLELGWDQQYGGIRYMLNIDRTPAHPLECDLKLWWPHGEALYALLLAWSMTGDPTLQQWYDKVHRYAFEHFPDGEHGEWYGYLNRDGSPVWTAKANGWKGFFHLPRVFLRAYQLLA